MGEKGKVVREHLDDVAHLGEDKFSAGGHTRTARALANLLKESYDTGTAIGLEGKWGAGKSNVTTMAAEELEKDGPYKFFNFDLWANQTNHFRRSFLEEFLNWLRNNSDINGDTIDKWSSRVSGRTKTITTSYFRRYSWLGITVLLIVPLLPFLILWISPFAANIHLYPEHYEQIPALQRLLLDNSGWLLGGAILLLVAAFFRDFRNTRKMQNFDWPTAFHKSLSLFARKSDQDTETQDIRDHDPTNYEFRKLFDEVLNRAQENGTRIVFVIDNIDRVPLDHVPDIWSEVRSVFCNYPSASGSSPVHAIVPYDRAYILKAFNQRDGLNPVSVGDEESDERTHDDFKRSFPLFVRDDIFRKTFSSHLSVAPPILSDLQNFMLDQLQYALPNSLTHQNQYNLFKIFDLHLDIQNTTPTPRQVKTFINELSSLFAEWEGSIAVESVAIYVLYRQTIEFNPKVLLSDELIEPRMLSYVRHENLTRDLAALAYNISPDIALEVLLKRDIRAALTEKDSQAISTLSKSPAFGAILPEVVEEEATVWASENPLTYAKAMRNLHECHPSDPVLSACVPYIVEALKNLKPTQSKYFENAKSLRIIVRLVERDRLHITVAAICNWLEKSLPEDLNERNIEHGMHWAQFIANLLDEVLRNHDEETVNALKEIIEIPRGAKIAIGVALSGPDTEYHYDDFIPSEIPDSYLDLLSEYATDTPTYFETLWAEFDHELEDEHRISVLKSIATLLNENKLSDEGESSRERLLTRMELVLRKLDGDPNNIVKPMIDNHRLAWHTSTAYEEGNTEEAMCGLWIIMRSHGANDIPRVNNPQNTDPIFGNMNHSRNWLVERYKGQVSEDELYFLGRVSDNHNATNFLIETVSRANDQHHIFNEVLESVASRLDHAPTNANVLMDNYKVIASMTDEARRNLLNSAILEEDTINHLKQSVSSLSPTFVQDAQNTDPEKWKAVLDEVDTYLKSIDADTWYEAFRQEGHSYKLLKARGSAIHGSLSPTSLKEPIEKYIVETITLENNKATRTELTHAIQALPPSVAKTLPGDILEAIDHREVTKEGIHAAVKYHFDIMKNLPFSTRPEVTIRKILIRLLQYGDRSAGELAEAAKKEMRKAVKNAATEALDEFKEYLIPLKNKENVRDFAVALEETLKLPKSQRD